MSDNEQLITDDNSYSGSDSESESSLNDSGSYESSFSDCSSDEEMESSDDLTQVRNFCELDITNPPSPPPRFPFTANPAVHLNIDLSNGTLQFLDIFFDDNLLEIIVSETNKYADRTIRNSNLRRKSRAKKWEPTTKNEIQVFLALNILQGIVKKPDVEQYWSKRHSTSTPFFTKIMSYRRFHLIHRYLHFSDDTKFDAKTHECPKLQKLWPIIKHLNTRYRETITPERDVTIDESLMLYKGRLHWKQYIPLKRSRFGIKSFILCESKSGYVYQLIIYTGKDTLFDDNYQHLCKSSQVVMTLMQPLLNKGYCLTTDNYYTSPELADILINRRTDIYGTLKLTRKDVPKELQKKKLKLGEICAYQRGKVCLIKWMDKKAVSLLSTIHNPIMIEVPSYKNEVRKKPKVVMEYNNTMGGVDRMDQHLTNYPVTKKRGKKYYKKIFFHLLEVSLWNAFVLYQKHGGKYSHLNFRLDIIDRLIERHGTVNEKKGRPGILPNPLRLTERHFLEVIGPSDKKLRPTRQCFVCCSKRNDFGKRVRKETRYFCPDCDVGLCLSPCFKIYHTKPEF
ncbi:PiggyBac transposable element-derived protein 4 [Araneus ventricosus]|uniref:PiggyBac transposable element-derived protein 4 n=1 Tax=Araneus ventricosus TaxID=182803 RepID=A0A4Y2EJF1_ARAVE|nr:PiggyBac transposable element-derived protein 4 [Araneus ventricosus]